MSSEYAVLIILIVVQVEKVIFVPGDDFAESTYCLVQFKECRKSVRWREFVDLELKG
jgi:hypothetical protein